MEFFTGKSPHRPLSQSNPSEIRLVKLYPGNFEDVVRCELVYTSLARHDAVYTAVSYAWGDPRVTDSILLDGMQFSVTINLQSFLRHMQAILLAITKSLPHGPQVPRLQTRRLRHLVVQSILQAPDFPQDFPFTADSVMHRLVERHIRKILAEEMEQGDSIDGVPNELHDNVGLCEPADCSMYFWIGALCINRRDGDERSQQVGRMKDVYSNARSLLIWLGDVSESIAEAAMSLIHDIQAVAWPYLEGRTEDMNQFLSTDFVQPRLDAILKFMQFLTQAWFSRTWVIQEVAAATGSTVALVRFQPVQWRVLTQMVFACCDKMLLSSDHLRPLLVMTEAHDKILKTLVELTNCYHEWTKETRIQPDDYLDEDVAQRLKQLLWCSKGLFKATDKRDLLYSLLGLLGTGNIPRELSPNYTVGFQEVFHQYAIYIIRNTKGLGFLPCYEKQDLEGVPSWVPDWRYCVEDQSQFNWISSDLAYSEVSTDGKRLEIDGINLGQVLAVIHPVSISAKIDQETLFSLDIPEGADNDDVTMLPRGILAVFRGMQKLRRACLDRAVGLGIPDSTFQTQWERFWPGYTHPSLQTQVEMLEERRKLDLFTVAQGASGAYFVQLAGEIRNLSQKGIAILDGGKLVSPVRRGEPMQEGDTICVLKGMKGPGILRREGLYYRFISDCRMTSLSPDILGEEFCGLRQVQRFVLI